MESPNKHHIEAVKKVLAPKEMQSQQPNEAVAFTPVHKYIQSLLPYLEHRQIVAQKLVNCKGNTEAENIYLEILDHTNGQILEILGIVKR